MARLPFASLRWQGLAEDCRPCFRRSKLPARPVRHIKSAVPAYRRPDVAPFLEAKTAVQDEPMVEHLQLGDDSKPGDEMQEANGALCSSDGVEFECRRGRRSLR